MEKDRFQVLASMVMGELTEVFREMRECDVRALLDEIQNSSRIFVLGAGREGLAARAFAMRLMHLGIQVYWIWDDTTPSIGSSDLMICACGSADVGHENYIAGMAKDQGARLALITPSDEGYLRTIADLTVKLPAAAYKAKGRFVESGQLMGNLFEQGLFIFFDILIMLLMDERKVSREEMTARHRNVE